MGRDGRYWLAIVGVLFIVFVVYLVIAAREPKCPAGSTAHWAQYAGWFCSVEPVK